MPDVTHQPQGSYPHSAAAHYLDLDTRADRLLASLPGREHVAETVAREAGVSLVLMAIEGGGTVREHSAPGTTTIHALRGHVIISATDQEFDCRPGDLVVFQPGVMHNLRAEEQSVLLLTVSGGQP